MSSPAANRLDHLQRQVSLRGDPITGDRYWSREFMQRERERMWTRVWHVGGLESQLERAGDYVVHNFMNESVVLVRQQEGAIRAFYNTCRHRGNRLVFAEEGGCEKFTCSYHGWVYGLDGTVQRVQDPEDFPQGNPCGKLRLKELPCDTWGGFVWYSMDCEASPLRDFLEPVPELLKNRELEKMVRVIWRTVDLNANWKFAPDNFNESYHLPTVHPQFRPVIDEDYRNTVFEMYPNGHNRMIEMGQPSLRADRPHEVEPAWAELLRAWDLDPAAFEGRAREGRVALQRQKRKLGPERGFTFYERWYDAELTDYFHHTLFPNVTLTGTPEGVHFFRTEPHPSNPERCTFDYWFFAPIVEGMKEVPTALGPRPLEPAPHEHIDMSDGVVADATMLGSFVDQDIGIAVTQQQGLRSRGYTDAYLSGQESRVRRFHEVLNDYLEGRR